MPYRFALAALLAVATGPARADIASPEECADAIATDPGLAREEAALWSRSGGGLPAGLCEAAALEALGANASAARLLTELAESPGHGTTREMRATLFENAARLWIAADLPDIALDTLGSADRLVPATTPRELQRARAHAAGQDWTAAREVLDTITARNPEDARALALRAAAERRDGAIDHAIVSAHAALEIDPDQPEALFEAGAAHAELGDREVANDYWMRLIRAHPDHDLATLARRNVAAPE